jgi:hypothetical protein
LEKIMLKKPVLIGSMLILSVLVLTQCNFPGRKSHATPTATPTTPVLSSLNTPIPPPTPTLEPTLCDNPYQPSRMGDAWVYTGNNADLGTYDHTQMIKSATSTAFTAENTLANVTYDVEYTCTEAGLVANNPVEQYLGALLNTPGSQISVKLNSVNGISLPKTINPGDQWQQQAQVDATLNTTNASGFIVFDYTAVGLESITVPAGTYQAMRVNLNVTIQVTPLRIQAGTYEMTMWMAPDVGIVKTTGTSHVPGIDFSDTTELSAFTKAP